MVLLLYAEKLAIAVASQVEKKKGELNRKGMIMYEMDGMCLICLLVCVEYL